MVSTSDVMREWLIVSGTSLYTLCGTRIWCPTKPPSETWSNTSAAIIFRPRSEKAHFTATPMIETMFDFFCYGGNSTYGSTETVYQALFDRLHGQTGAVATSGTIVTATQISAQQGPPEPDTGWPVYIAVYHTFIQ